ncbi:zinc-binding alcohol dehydrogenase family protein [Weissella diestrammenae]|uniref:Zinc-binding alcohol dehydrogenase family protein n=2 Tax=Weissella diestrammenae TaxID=1162633 RepID=A0A7G9T7L9_9LACO|nr:zinc-binding alcohol dehydrogenase family protein [Weissella diestrammenae]QNN76094.1 zinc-binding alcohol dehydrogenase family protein [Weissella diestrammenae]
MTTIMTTSDSQVPLTLIQTPLPQPEPFDLLVKISAVSVNPVDLKQAQVAVTNQTPKILGYDAVGTVVDTGAQASKFKIGDRVMFAGAVNRQGSYAEFEAVHEDLVALAPSNIADAQLAGVPLSFLTAYELLIDKFRLIPSANANQGQSIFIINGAGGVGSSMIQLAKWLGLTVIASASRPKTIDWVQSLGADHVVNHRLDYLAEIKAMGIDTIPYIAILHNPNQHFTAAAELISPFGHIGSIVENATPLPIERLKSKAASFDWEFMFAKSLYHYHMASQGTILALAGELLTTHTYKTPVTQTLAGLSLDTIHEAHQLLTSNQLIGKLTITY